MAITTEEVLRSAGLDTALLHNPRFTKAISKELKKRGYRRVVVMKDGVRRGMWVADVLQEFDAAKAVELAIAKEEK